MSSSMVSSDENDGNGNDGHVAVVVFVVVVVRGVRPAFSSMARGWSSHSRLPDVEPSSRSSSSSSWLSRLRHRGRIFVGDFKIPRGLLLLLRLSSDMLRLFGIDVAINDGDGQRTTDFLGGNFQGMTSTSTSSSSSFSSSSSSSSTLIIILAKSPHRKTILIYCCYYFVVDWGRFRRRRTTMTTTTSFVPMNIFGIRATITTYLPLERAGSIHPQFSPGSFRTQ